jgi:hypothetical protein
MAAYLALESMVPRVAYTAYNCSLEGQRFKAQGSIPANTADMFSIMEIK